LRSSRRFEDGLWHNRLKLRRRQALRRHLGGGPQAGRRDRKIVLRGGRRMFRFLLEVEDLNILCRGLVGKQRNALMGPLHHDDADLDSSR